MPLNFYVVIKVIDVKYIFNGDSLKNYRKSSKGSDIFWNLSILPFDLLWQFFKEPLQRTAMKYIFNIGSLKNHRKNWLATSANGSSTLFDSLCSLSPLIHQGDLSLSPLVHQGEFDQWASSSKRSLSSLDHQASSISPSFIRASLIIRLVRLPGSARETSQRNFGLRVEPPSLREGLLAPFNHHGLLGFCLVFKRRWWSKKIQLDCRRWWFEAEEEKQIKEGYSTV